MFDPVGRRLDVAEHHGGRAAAAQAVPAPADLQPAVSRHFARTHLAPDPIHKDFRPAARQVPNPASFSRTSTSRIGGPDTVAIWSISGGLKPWTLICGNRA